MAQAHTAAAQRHFNAAKQTDSAISVVEHAGAVDFMILMAAQNLAFLQHGRSKGPHMAELKKEMVKIVEIGENTARLLERVGEIQMSIRLWESCRRVSNAVL